MVKEVIWTPEAEISFAEIIAYLEENWGARVVTNFIGRVDLVINTIIQDPFVYRSAGKEDVREALITKHNLLLYRITRQMVYLLYFWDTRKNPAAKPLPE